jgi:hypothetical protein
VGHREEGREVGERGGRESECTVAGPSLEEYQGGSQSVMRTVNITATLKGFRLTISNIMYAM